VVRLPAPPLPSVKLDRSFIVNAGQSAGDAAVFRSIVQLAHALKLVVVAEGVETTAHPDLAAACGCDGVQGYLIARTTAPRDFELWKSPAPKVHAPADLTEHDPSKLMVAVSCMRFYE
jgi:EAL domain-containing protein (putative c-di-GMP-specific phosphodiesterase class I)